MKPHGNTPITDDILFDKIISGRCPALARAVGCGLSAVSGSETG